MATRSWLISSPLTETLPARPHLRVQLVGGNVEVSGHDGGDIVVEVLDIASNPLEVVLDDAMVALGYPSIGWEGWVKRLTSFRSSDVCRVKVRVPRGTRVSLATAAAGIAVSDLGADATLNSAAGIIYTTGIVGKVTARTFSGAVTLDRQDGPVTVQSASGVVSVQGSSAHVGISTGSGAVNLRSSSPTSAITVSTISGDLDVTLPQTGLVLTARTVSGAVDVDGTSRRTSSGPAVVSVDERTSASACWLTTNTISGALRVHRVGSDSM